jgi:putative phosphoserine phosphatase/1-acylglycerol-3-phosphate O-acyltransferase
METIFSKDSNTSKNYIAFFDLDRTIIHANSGKLLIQQGYKHGLMTRMDIIKGIYLSLLYRLDLKDTAKIIDTMVNWVKGVSESAVNELSAEIFKNYILISIHHEVQSEISFHKREGARVVILSSSILPVCQYVADYLGMDDVICSNLEVVNEVFTGHPSGSLCFGEEKVARLIEYCKKNSVSPTHSWYYGDSISDLPVLCSVGNPVCINPDKKLKKEAYKRGWKILQWH